jgi:predicted enzyme related to lactoylglutathione lyase
MDIDNAINWFEIPVANFDRAKKFYETLFDYQMPESQLGAARMGFFLFDFQNKKVGGAIVHNPALYTPEANGTLVYLNCQPDLQKVLDKVETAGGNILLGKKEISAEQKLGFWALISDTEGNRVALHSMG